MASVKKSGRVRVAAAQLAGRFFEVDRDVERICGAIRDAAKQGIRLVCFPECFVGGYPYWRGHVSVRQETELGARLHECAIKVPGQEVAEIAGHCVRYGIGAIVGVNEKDDLPGSCSTFNTLLYFHPERGYAGRHRKLIPTHTERAYWDRGNREDLIVVDYPFARVGGLICYEHHMLLSRMALAVMGEEIHCAVWPGYWQTGRHIADKIPGPASEHCEIDAVVRDYAMSTQSFVVSANALVQPASLSPELAQIMGYNLARGGSAIVDPSGRYLMKPVLDEEGLVKAEIDLKDRVLCKSYLDTVGHYARWDVFDFSLRPAVAKPGYADRASAAQSLPAAEAVQIETPQRRPPVAASCRKKSQRPVAPAKR